ncbi:DUF2520 domain-containing protein [Leucobacter viscericola]|uniref:DUF2520 domain-containing protein n=2 Tax=Leucobacter viscericola TaxID=2714935 RepID=A0A6G7XK19_9MICO|nr:DUF2520 domain-containing protein [Leucobacter viscericola]QIK64862.1 DUF2520 domain-containing protein [Leucobacter viscericola]
MGAALDAALRTSNLELLPPAGRGADGASADIVLLAVPDAEIASAAAAIAPGRIVGHLSGITTLAALQPHEAFSLHPLMTVTGPGTSFAGAHAAIAGTSERALQAAQDLAERLGMVPFRVADADRAAYHAAASIASNYLVTLEGLAEQLAETAGVPRAALLPLAEASLRNWAERGAASALTGPVVRGDEATVRAQRDAVAERLPEHVALFDALTDATRTLAGGQQ